MFGLGMGRLGITGGSGSAAWTPAQLWPLGATSPGCWIDPPYTASEFQESTGVTPLSAIGTVLDTSNPVGLILDRKGGLALGAELVTNGSFASGATGWDVYGPSIGSGVCQFTSGAGVQELIQTNLSVGENYRMSFVVSNFVAAGNLRLRLGNEGLDITVPITGNGTYSLSVTGSVSTTTHFVNYGTASLAVTNISVREIPGIHLSMATSAARPVGSARKNQLVGTATLSTQSVTVTAIPYTISFAGAGTIVATGTYVGALTNGQTFTPTAGTLTLTVAGSVTTAQLERGSVVTSYQAVVSDSSYTASGFPIFQKYDGADDSLASATFAAGTLTSSMDCLIAVRRDSAANVILINESADNFFGCAQSGSGALSFSNCGSPTTWVDGVQLAGGTAVTRGTLHTALTAGDFHIFELRGLDLSAWAYLSLGNWGGGYQLNGALGDTQLFSSGQDANRDKARAAMAAYFGVTLA